MYTNAIKEDVGPYESWIMGPEKNNNIPGDNIMEME